MRSKGARTASVKSIGYRFSEAIAALYHGKIAHIDGVSAILYRSCLGLASGGLCVGVAAYAGRTRVNMPEH